MPKTSTPKLPPVSAKPSTRPLAAEEKQSDTASQRTSTTTTRSSVQKGSHHGSTTAGPQPPAGSAAPPNAAPSEGHASVKTSSQRSITSSQALSKLQQLEELLLAERKAREQAEETLVALQRERIARDEATHRSEAAQQQLGDVMSALRTAVSNPSDPTTLRKLQAILRGNPKTVSAAEQPASAYQSTVVGPSVKPVSAPGNKKDDAVDADSSSTAQRLRAANGQISFLDGLGQYERDRAKEKVKAKAEAAAIAAAASAAAAAKKAQHQ